MTTADPYNIKVKNPEDLIYVSAKHWANKLNVERNDPLVSMFGRPGPLSGLMLIFIDVAVELILKCIFYLYELTEFAFDWINNMTFGNFKGIIPKTFGGGTVITTKFFRYTINLLLPPLGIMLSKGIYGWFSIISCILITYINYLGGIIFAFLVTSKNRYADQYEAFQLLQFKNNHMYKEDVEDTSAFYSSTGFICLIIVIFVLFLSVF